MGHCERQVENRSLFEQRKKSLAGEFTRESVREKDQAFFSKRVCSDIPLGIRDFKSEPCYRENSLGARWCPNQ